MSDKQPYESPHIEELGTIDELTAQTGNGDGSVIISDRAVKESVEPVDPERILRGVEEIDVSRWSYASDRPAVRHIGPMAQDFAAAFEVGGDPRRIHTADMNGVALAAIKALKATVDRQQAELEELREKLERLDGR